MSESRTLAISGMTCAACAARIEKGLNKMQGVKATVNLAMETAHVEYAPSTVTAAEIIKKIEQLGYRAELRSELKSDKDRRRQEIRRQQWILLFFLYC